MPYNIYGEMNPPLHLRFLFFLFRFPFALVPLSLVLFSSRLLVSLFVPLEVPQVSCIVRRRGL